MERNRKLAELQRIVEGQSKMNERMAAISPVLPMNRYKYGLDKNRSVKAASRLPKRIVLHPKRQRLNQEKSKKLAELYTIIRGE
jgi:hypothetical protein